MKKFRKVFNKDGSVKKLIYPSGIRRYWWNGVETDVDFYWHAIIHKRLEQRLQRPYTPPWMPDNVNIGVDFGNAGDYSVFGIVRRETAVAVVSSVQFTIDVRLLDDWETEENALGKWVGVYGSGPKMGNYHIVENMMEAIGRIIEIRGEVTEREVERYLVIETVSR